MKRPTIATIRTNLKNIFFVSPAIIGAFIALYIVGIGYANSTQSIVYSQDIPRGMVCIKDTIPHAYVCSPDQEIPWYISEKAK